MSTAEPEKSGLTLRLFGPFEAHVEGVPLPPVRSRKILWALALLTLRNGRPVDREWLARTLWPETDLTQALANLRPALSALRTALGTQASRIESPDRRTLRLDLEGAFADVAIFDKLVASSRSTDLELAVDLYRGPLLEGCAEEWVFQERDSRERACVAALLRLGEIATHGGNFALAADRYRRAVTLMPLADSPRRALMEALVQGGDRNGALDVYRQFADLLRAEINAEPEEATSRLYLQLRRQIREDGRGSAPRPGPYKAVGQLPHPLANLVGREEERTEVISEIRRSRLVTLVGPGGIGKTRLAIEAAREVARDYPDGAWWVALEALSNEDLLERHIASVFELREEPGRPLASILTDFLREKRLLLVLDNCEHLLRPSARFADWLLRECGSVKILATSRESLGLSGERIWSVPSLPYPDLDHLPENPSTRRRVLAAYESVELFVERATAAHRDFALTSNNATAVAQICTHLEGIPLAIELAAARTKAMKVDEISRRLGEGLSLLTGGRNLPARQRTLRATLDWSYGLLSDNEQRILRRLSVFSGGWMLPSAECVVVGGGIEEADVVDLLESLVDKSLVGFDDSRGWYRLSEPVRQYATEMRMASEENEAVTQAHTDWCVQFAETADGHLRGPEHRTWMARLLEVRDNFRSALDRRPTLPLAAALSRFWRIKGDYGEGIHYLTEALGQPDEVTTPLRAKALSGLGELFFAQSDFVKAKDCFEVSLALGYAGSMNQLAKVAHEQGDDDTALRLAEEGLNAARLSGDKSEIANCLVTLSQAVQSRSGSPSGAEFLAEALALHRMLADQIGTAYCLIRLTHLCRFGQDPSENQKQYREALGIFQELDDRSGIATTLFGLAQEAMRTEHYPEAVTHWREALKIYQALGERRGVLLTLAYLGKALAIAGELSEAKELLCQSLSQSLTVSAKGGSITSIEYLAILMTRLRRHELATQLIAYSNRLREQIGTIRGPLAAAEYSDLTAEALEALGDEEFQKEWKTGETLDEARILSLVSAV